MWRTVVFGQVVYGCVLFSKDFRTQKIFNYFMYSLAECSKVMLSMALFCFVLQGNVWRCDEKFSTV